MRRIGELEASVMDVLWTSAEPMTVREALEQINGRSKKQLAYTTILSVINNLHGKDLLQRDDSERAFRYSPAVTREQYTAELMAQTLDTTIDRQAALLHFVGSLDAEDRAALLSQARRLKP